MPEPETAVAPSQAKRLLKLCIAANQSVCLWGTYGIGKSDLVRQVGLEMGFESVIDIRLPLLDATDIRGLPNVGSDGITRWMPPAFLPQSGRHIVFLDELNRAPILVQNGALQVSLPDATGARRVGEYTMPDECAVVAACNRESDGGGIQRMPAALAARFQHIEVRPDLQDYCTWAIANNVSPLTIAFLRFRPDLLCVPDPKSRTGGANPRSWTQLDRLMQSIPDADLELPLAAGKVGHGQAIEYLAFAQLFRTLPSMDAILLNPDTAPVPAEIGTLYAVSSALGARATHQNWSAVLTYLDRLPIEYAVFAVKDALQRDASLGVGPDFIAWSVKHQGAL